MPGEAYAVRRRLLRDRGLEMKYRLGDLIETKYDLQFYKIGGSYFHSVNRDERVVPVKPGNAWCPKGSRGRIVGSTDTSIDLWEVDISDLGLYVGSEPITCGFFYTGDISPIPALQLLAECSE